MDVSRAITEAIKIWLALGAVGLALAWPRVPARARSAALWLLVAVAGANYARWGPETPFERVDAYDLLHYYVNAKYFDELGYYDLYPCLILADHENDGPWWDEGRTYMAQHEGGHVLNPIGHAVARGRHVRDTRFTPERWSAFEHDALVLSRDLWMGGAEVWQQMIIDHGYNGPPAWALVGGPIATLVPVEAVKWLGWLDVVVLVGALVLVARAWDRDTAAWVALFLLVTYSTRWPTITWVLLRYDYVALLLAATAAARLGRGSAAGALVGFASALRLFPVLWAFGPVARGAVAWWRGSRPRFAIGFLAAALAAGGGSVALAAWRYGPEQFTIHLDNMRDHTGPDQLSSRRIGLALALTHRIGLDEPMLSPARREAIGRQAPARLALAGALLLALGWALRRARDEEVVGFGFLPLFLLTTASYYYYVIRGTLVVVHAGALDQPRNRVGLAWLFALEAGSNAAETYFPGDRMFLIGYLAWGLLAYTLGMTAWLAYEARAADAAGQGDVAG